MSESPPFIFGGMTKTEGFEVCPNSGETRRQNESKKINFFNWFPIGDLGEPYI